MRAALRKWKHALPWILLACAVMGCAMTAYTCGHEEDQYRAVFTMFTLPNAADAEKEPLEAARMLARDMQALTETESFRQMVLQSTYSDGLSYVRVRGVDGAHMVEVEVTGPDPKTITDMANAIGRELCAQIPELFQARGTREVESAQIPEMPCAPNRPVKIGLCVAVTFLLGSALGAACGSDRVTLAFDDEAADGFFLGAMPEMSREMARYEKKCRKGRQSGTLLDGLNRLMRECVRKTALNLRTAQTDGRVLLMTAQREDDQTPAVAALTACELARQGFRVLLVETDAERGALSRWLGVQGEADVYDYVRGRAELGEVLRRTSIDTLTFADALHPEISVADYAALPTFAQFLNSARERFDWILIHARDLTSVSDAAMLSLSADAAVFTVRNRRSTLSEVEDAARQLAMVGRPASGVIFTGVPQTLLAQDE